MGNCTSKKSAKSLKLSATKKPIFLNKMDKDQENHPKGLSKKIAPFTKGEVTSFGFKKKPPSQLPIPVTLTSNGHHESNEKMVQNRVANHKNLSDGYQSGSSVESLCHAPLRSTPKMIRKRDLVRQQIASSNETDRNSNSINGNNKNNRTTFQTIPTSIFSQNDNNSNVGNASKTNFEPSVNRFGFRQATPPRTVDDSGRTVKNNGVAQVSRAAFLTGQGPYDTGSYAMNKKSEVSSRSRSEGPREAFFKQTLQPANSVQSGLNQSKTSLSNLGQPGKFTFQTSHLPRPQFAVRMTDTKTAKTAANNYRKEGVRSDSNSSKEGSLNEDSGFESHTSANNTLERNIEILESSPGCKVRRRLPAYKGKKLEMKIVGNKFELLKKDEENSPDVVTEISLIKLPTSNIRTTTAIINTGLVEQRTNQYLKKISQPYQKNSDVGLNDPNRHSTKSKAAESSDSNNGDEGLGAESEEEKLFKDSRKSEKNSDKYLMSDGCGDADDMLPGEAMADDFSICLSFEEDTKGECSNKVSSRPTFQPEIDVTPNTIRLDALKLSKQLKYKNGGSGSHQKGECSSFELLATSEKDEETFPSDSILEQLSSDSDSLGDKGENKNNDKEKNFKIADLNLEKEDLGIDLDEEDNNTSKSDTDVDENELELNIDEAETKDVQNNCLGTASPDSPGTPTHASNSLSLSDGRDFLIDDEIADQPQLCFSENYVDCSCQEEVKTAHEKTLTSANGEFVTCSDVNTQTMRNEEVEKRDEIDEEVEKEVESIGKEVSKEGRSKRLNSEGTLSPCESIASDDLMLDFESNSFDETAERFDIVNENSSVESLCIPTRKEGTRENIGFKQNVGQMCKTIETLSNMNKTVTKSSTLRSVRRRHHEELTPVTPPSSPRHRTGSGRLKTRESASGCSTPASIKSSEMVSRVVSSPLRSSRSTPADEDSIKVDKISYQDIFQDIVSMKTMLLKLKRILSESEGGLLENGRVSLQDGALSNIMEDELTDLRRQVLFLQQQLEEREKTVQVLRLEINKTSEPAPRTGMTDSRKQTNAATQTGLDQFQQDFPHFRIFQTTPVV